MSLSGKTALVTGVSRRRGIGFAIATHLARAGAHLIITHNKDHDEAQEWGGDDLEALLAELRQELSMGASLTDHHIDFADPHAAAQLFESIEVPVDILIANHAMSGRDSGLADMTPENLEVHWRVNCQSVLMLTREFARQGRSGGRVVWMSSGQALGPMPGEVAYAGSKAGLIGILPTVADELVDHGILLNAVNPGPVNTGYMDEELLGADVRDELMKRFPLGRFGEPDDVARLVMFLVGDEGRWLSGQVINSEGGFRR